MKRLSIALLWLLPALAAAQDRYPANSRPTCNDGTPRAVMLTQQTDEDDCDNVSSGTAEAYCECKDGTWSKVDDGSGAGISDGDKGDITVSGSGGIFMIDPDAVTEPYLKVVNAATDEHCLTYEVTTGDFEWQTCGGGGSGGCGAPYEQYDPLRPPATANCAFCEEFTGNAEALTWRWQNQDAATITYALDAAVLTGDTSADQYRVRWTTAPANSDQTVTMLFNLVSFAASIDGCGVTVLTGGTEATPTEIIAWDYANAGTDRFAYTSQSDYNMTGQAAIGTNITSWALGDVIAMDQIWLQLRYIDSTRALTAFYSFDGFNFLAHGTTKTVANDPVSWGFYSRDGGACRLHLFRGRTDADRNDASDAAVAGCGGISDGDKGDITVSGSGTVWEIDPDAVDEATLKAVNSPTDEYVLTYESTTGDFEWQAGGVGGASLIVEEDNSTVDGAAMNLDFNEPDATLVTSSPSGEANIDMSKYALLNGRSGGQTLYGGDSTSDYLRLYANSVDLGSSLFLDPSTGISMTLPVGGTFRVSNLSGAVIDFDGSGTGKFESSLGLGSDATSTATQSCAWVDSDRWFGDLDCDNTKDGGEEYFDLAGGGGGGSGLTHPQVMSRVSMGF